MLSPAFRHRDLIVFDQRGTGRSGLLRCRALERSNLFDAGRAGRRVRQRLGARPLPLHEPRLGRGHRGAARALGLDRIALYGTSYGVKVALGYALTYPAHVERLVLDSVLEVDGPDPLYRPDAGGAPPRAARALPGGLLARSPPTRWTTCAGSCGRMGTRGVRGQVVDERGRRRPARVAAASSS